MKPAGAISGNYTDASGLSHSFVRAPDGGFTTFDAPGAGPSSGQGTFSGGIDPAGTIVRSYIDARGVNHGYVRAAEGTIDAIDVPGAGTASGQGTTAGKTNPAGVIVGLYVDANNVKHGFVRARDGSITTFDAPDAGTGGTCLGFYSQGTYPYSNNSAGMITGWSVDASCVLHGFLRIP
jgi:hypothetical protein